MVWFRIVLFVILSNEILSIAIMSQKTVTIADHPTQQREIGENVTEIDCHNDGVTGLKASHKE